MSRLDPAENNDARRGNNLLLGQQSKQSGTDADSVDFNVPDLCKEIEFIFGHSESANAEPIQWKWKVAEGKKGAVGETIFTVRQNGSMGLESVRVQTTDRYRKTFVVVFGSGGGSVVVKFWGR